MTMPSNAEPQIASATTRSTRPFYWSVRRELWENRAIYLAPLIAAAVVLAGIVFATVHPPQFHQTGSGRHMSDAELRTLPYIIAAVAIMLIGVVVGIFYSLGALHNERRDRSILFWKSLPVSDRVAVASKAMIPFVVLPVCAFATMLVTHLLMLALHAASLAAHGQDPGLLLAQVPILKLWLVTGWGLVAFTLWWAPVWGWLFLISAWARRITFVWAIAPPIALAVFERLALGTDYVGKLLQYRLGGSSEVAFAVHAKGSPLINLPDPDPLGFLATPGLWIGLVIGAAFFAAAIWLRRRSEPI